MSETSPANDAATDANLPAERRLRHREQARGTAEAAEFGDVDEGVELFQVHAATR